MFMLPELVDKQARLLLDHASIGLLHGVVARQHSDDWRHSPPLRLQQKLCTGAAQSEAARSL